MLARAGSSAGLHVRLIGELTISADGAALPMPASRKTRALFVYLLQARRAVRRERLCELFFDIPDDPRAALRWSLTKIRAMLGPRADALIADRERVAIAADGFVTDVDRLKMWTEALTLPEEAIAAAEQAREPPLAGLELGGLDDWDAWLAAERAAIDRARGRFLARVAADERLAPEERALFAREAAAIDPDPAPRAASIAPAAPPAAMPAQMVRYCLAQDGAQIAYACTGDGPPLVKTANWLNHLELDWSSPIWGTLFAALSREHMLVRYDERGNGLSDWDVTDLSFDAFVRDLETVVDRLEIDRFPLFGISQGCAVAIEYAARHPQRVSSMVLLGGYAAGWRLYAGPVEREQREAVITLVRTGWAQDNPAYRQIFSQTFMPSATRTELDWFNEFQRRTASGANAARFLEAFSHIDVRHRLGDVRCPTLVLHARGDQRVALSQGIELAASIPGASLVTLETDSHIPLSREPAAARVIECIEEFLRAPLALAGAPAVRRWAN